MLENSQENNKKMAAFIKKYALIIETTIVKQVFSQTDKEQIVKDIKSDTYEKFCNIMHKEPEKLWKSEKAWIIRVVQNTARDYFRRKAKERSDEPYESIPEKFQPSINTIYEGDAAQLPIDMKEGLTTQQEKIFPFLIEGMPHQEIAKICDTTYDSVKVQIQNIRKRVRYNLLKKHASLAKEYKTIIEK